jgi:hypothetical protein
MTGLIPLVNVVFGGLMWLLLLRFLIHNWTRGGAVGVPVITFIVLRVFFDDVVALVGAGLILLFVPNLARSPIGGALMRLLVRVTDPLIDLVRRGSGGRIGGGPAMLIAALLVLAFAVGLVLALRSVSG